jgi:hypothetical protein
MKRIAKTTTPKMLPFNQTWERIWKLTKDIPMQGKAPDEDFVNLIREARFNKGII